MAAGDSHIVTLSVELNFTQEDFRKRASGITAPGFTEEHASSLLRYTALSDKLEDEKTRLRNIFAPMFPTPGSFADNEGPIRDVIFLAFPLETRQAILQVAHPNHKKAMRRYNSNFNKLKEACGQCGAALGGCLRRFCSCCEAFDDFFGLLDEICAQRFGQRCWTVLCRTAVPAATTMKQPYTAVVPWLQQEEGSAKRSTGIGSA